MGGGRTYFVFISGLTKPLIKSYFLFISGLTKPQLYKQSSSTKDINRIKDQLNQNLNSVELSGCQDVHIICGVLKWYLRELPNPVIAMENYTDFIKAISKYTSPGGPTCIKNTVCLYFMWVLK